MICINEIGSLKKMRIEMLLTQQELAKIMGVSNTSVSIWEKTGCISLRHLRQLMELHAQCKKLDI